MEVESKGTSLLLVELSGVNIRRIADLPYYLENLLLFLRRAFSLSVDNIGDGSGRYLCQRSNVVYGNRFLSFIGYLLSK